MTENSDASTCDPAARTATLPTMLNLASQTTSPVEFGSLELDESGQIRKRQNTAPLAFSFRYHDLRFEAEVEVESQCKVRLTVPLGKLPYTAESSSARQHLREVIGATQYHGGGRLFLSTAHDITFEAEAEPPAPCTPVGVMATVVSLLLKSQPLLDSISELMKGLGRRSRSAPAKCTTNSRTDP